MSEEAFHFFYEAAVLIIVLLHAGCFTSFFLPFLKDRGAKYGKRAGIVFLIYTLAYVLCVATPVPQIVSFLLICLFLSSLSGFLRVDRPLVFLLIVLFFSTRTSSALIIESIDYLSDKTLFQDISQPDLLFLRSAAMFAMVTLLRLLLFAGMLYFLRHRLLEKPFSLHRRESCFLCVIPVTCILSGMIIVRLLGMIKDGVYLQLYEQHPVFLGIVPLISILFYMGTDLTIAFHQEIQELRKEKEASFIKEQQWKAVRKRMDESGPFDKGIRQMKQEMEGHLSHIRNLAETEGYDEIGQYIRQIDRNLRLPDLAIRTGNAVTDVILNDKYQQARNAGITFQTDFHYPDSGQYQAYDIGIILHNLLQNALDACEKTASADRYIWLSGRQRKKFFLIEVKNPYEGKILLNPHSGLPDSTKDVHGLHGIGLSSVRREAQKYQGEIEIRTEDQEFYVTILLQERSNQEKS